MIIGLFVAAVVVPSLIVTFAYVAVWLDDRPCRCEWCEGERADV